MGGMMTKKQSQEDLAIRKKAEVKQAMDLVFGLGSVLLVGSILFFMFYKIIYGLQKFLYQRPGENLIGSYTIAKIGISALVIGLIFFVIDFFCRLIGKFYPNFYARYWCNPNGNLQINEKAFKKFKIALGSIFICGVCATFFLFNEYISLGDTYIAASTPSFMHNRKQYEYSDVKIWKKLRRDPKYGWLYTYEFPDGKRISGELTVDDAHLIKMIQTKQKELGLNIATVNIGPPSRQSKSSLESLSYLIKMSGFLFVPWILSKLFKRKK